MNAVDLRAYHAERVSTAQQCQRCPNKFFHVEEVSLCDVCERRLQEQVQTRPWTPQKPRFKFNRNKRNQK